MQVSDGCGIIFNPLFVKKNGYGTKAQKQYTITQCNTHTQIFSMKQLFELSSLNTKIHAVFKRGAAHI
jgi:hypothetical protein